MNPSGRPELDRAWLALDAAHARFELARRYLGSPAALQLAARLLHEAADNFADVQRETVRGFQ